MWHCIGDGDQNNPQEKEMPKKAKWLSEEALQTAEKNRSKRQRRKGKLYLSEFRVTRNSKESEKAFLSEQCKEIKEKNRMGNISDIPKKIRDTKGISCKYGHNKGQRWSRSSRGRRY